ncbi:hypothetical protein B484DRAFT_443429 [Ochromonadaceae sp. CCMP2298]|nr:hypothetical protein B484DRAFT_443429 [Ochromonadaceae sp. CCMP2298]
MPTPEAVVEPVGTARTSETAGISGKVRRTLIGQLGYLPDEADAMDPQIASVVVHRQLSRPRKGMPQSWKCTAPVLGSHTTTRSIGLAWAAPLEALRKGLAEAASSPLVKGAVGLGLLWLSRQPLAAAGGLVLGQLRGLGRLGGVVGSLSRMRLPLRRPTGSTVDLAALGRATDVSAWDRVHVKANVLRNKVF